MVEVKTKMKYLDSNSINNSFVNKYIEILNTKNHRIENSFPFLQIVSSNPVSNNGLLA